MIRLHAAMSVVFLTAGLGACHPMAKPAAQTATAEAAMSITPPEPSVASMTLAPAGTGTGPGGALRAAFFLGELSDTDGDIQGCTTTLSRASSETGRAIFAEDGVDTNAVGFIRIDDKLMKVGLVSSTPGDKGGVRVFASKDKTVQVVENYVTGAEHQESDSVELTGTLVVTVRGESQTFMVSGGTAC